MSTPSPAVLSGAEIDAKIADLESQVNQNEISGFAGIVRIDDARWLLAQLREARKDSARIDWMDARGFSLMPMFDPAAKWSMCDETLAYVDRRPTTYFGQSVREVIDEASKEGR